MIASKRITVAVLLLLTSSVTWGQSAATHFQSNLANYNLASNVVPSDMLAQLWNPPASGFNIFIDEVIVSWKSAEADDKNALEVGLSLDPVFNDTCTVAETSPRIGGTKPVPAGMFSGFPCSAHPKEITDESFERYYMRSGERIVDTEKNPIPLEPGRGFSVWNAYDRLYSSWKGDITVTIKWHQCPILERCE